MKVLLSQKTAGYRRCAYYSIPKVPCKPGNPPYLKEKKGRKQISNLLSKDSKNTKGFSAEGLGCRGQRTDE